MLKGQTGDSTWVLIKMVLRKMEKATMDGKFSFVKSCQSPKFVNSMSPQSKAQQDTFWNLSK